MSSPLFHAFPKLEGQIPWTPLGRFPTRIHRLARLGADTGARELWIKRDDESGLPYGGNKVRKLEHVLADAKGQGATRLCTVGGVGSHLSVAAGIFAPAFGMEVVATVVSHEMDDHAKQNLRAALGAGVTFELLRSRLSLPLRLATDYARQRVLRNGSRPYVIAPGASSPLGTLGYVGAAFELRDQIARGELPEPEVIVVAFGSGGTLAGLTLGARLAGLHSRVVGVRVTPRSVASRTSVSLLGASTALLLKRHGVEVPTGLLRPQPVEVIHGYYGGAYGRPTPASKDAVIRMHQLEGIDLENTYTGKAMAGLLELIRAQQLYHRPLLFWNTVSSVDLHPLLDKAPRRETVEAGLRRYLDE